MKTARFVFVLAFLVCGSLQMYAAGGGQWWGSGDTDSLTLIIYSVRNSLLTICKVVMIIGSLSALALAVMNWMEGDSSAAKRFAIWLAGLLVGFVLLNAVQWVGKDAGATGAGAFYSVSVTVKSVLIALLSIVQLVTVVQKVFQVIHGEKEGGRQLFKWFAVSLAGQIMLSAI